MSLKGTAAATLEILERGAYTTSSGATATLRSELQAAVAGTRLYTPDSGRALLERESAAAGAPPRISVTSESTQEAARRLAVDDGVDDIVLLNFASARNVGGGFLGGARAQEEDLCRCSGLYPCLETQREFYHANRMQHSMLYTDHIIYSPKVPWFRTRHDDLLERPFLASVITAPAPNAGEALARDAAAGADVERVLRHRAGLVLAIAREHGHRTLLLGAWGCGVFRNDPATVADAFGRWLAAPAFAGCFDRVDFAIYDRSPQQSTLAAFQEYFRA